MTTSISVSSTGKGGLLPGNSRVGERAPGEENSHKINKKKDCAEEFTTSLFEDSFIYVVVRTASDVRLMK